MRKRKDISAVELPFATIHFLQEPQATKVERLQDLPDLLLNFVDPKTAQIYPFHVKVEVKKFDAPIDEDRARQLVRDRMDERILWFSQTMSEDCHLEPQWGGMCYDLSNSTIPRTKTLRPDAREVFYRELVEFAVQSIDSHSKDRDSGVMVGFFPDRVELMVKLPGQLILSTQELSFGFGIFGRSAGSKCITGTGTVFGRPCSMKITDASDHRGYSGDRGRDIRHWVTAEVLRQGVLDAIHDYTVKSRENSSTEYIIAMAGMISDMTFDNLSGSIEPG